MTRRRSGLRAQSKFLLISLAFSLGCASDRSHEYRSAFERGDYAKAIRVLEELEKRHPRDAHLYAMERGIASLAGGDVAGSLRALKSARDRVDELGTDYGAFFKSALLDDTALKYEAADYEQVVMRALLAVVDLMSGGQDANAYALQVLERQEEIRSSFKDESGNNPKQGYKLVAFGSYLSGMLSEESPLKVSSARRAYARVREIEPDLPFIDADIERVTNGRHSEPGHGVVRVIALVGRAPFRVETESPVTQDVLAILQLVWQIHRGGVILPMITRVKIPALAFHGDNPTEVHVYADGAGVGATGTVTSVDQTAGREFEAMHEHIVARAALRRAVKITITEGVRGAVTDRPRGHKYEEGDSLLDFGISLLGNLWTAAESADLRCWSLLPAAFQVLRVELPAGEHEIVLRAGRDGMAVGREQRIRVLVRDGYNTYVVGVAPTLEGGPPPRTSDSLEGDFSGVDATPVQ